MKANERTDNLSQASPSPEAGADDIDKGVANARVKYSAVTNQGSKPTASFVVDTIQKRIKYYEEKSLTSGWASYESGPCCEKCAMRTEHFTGRADALKAIVGCRNPFQLESVCQCHIPVRRAVIHGITNALSQLVSVLGDNAEEFRFSGGVSDEQSGSQQASPDLLETERERVYSEILDGLPDERSETVNVDGEKFEDFKNRHLARFYVAEAKGWNDYRNHTLEVIERLRNAQV